eukprot:1952067-Rhodomonas_salina.3
MMEGGDWRSLKAGSSVKGVEWRVESGESRHSEECRVGSGQWRLKIGYRRVESRDSAPPTLHSALPYFDSPFTIHPPI